MENETALIIKKLGIDEKLNFNETIPILKNYVKSDFKEIEDHVYVLENESYILTIDFNKKEYSDVLKPVEGFGAEGWVFDFYGNPLREIKSNDEITTDDIDLLKDVRPLIGTASGSNYEFHWEFKNPEIESQDIIIEGKSSPCKYCLIQNLVVDLSYNHIPSFIVDCNGEFNFLKDNLPNKFSKNVYKIPFDPFKKFLRYSENGFIIEDNIHVAQRFISWIHQSFNEINSKELSVIYVTVLKSLDKYKHFNLNKLKNELNITGEHRIINKLWDLFEDDPFNDGATFDWSYLDDNTGKVKLFDLSSYSEITQKFVYDVLLNDLWNYKVMEGQWSFPFFAVLDNAENINININSPAYKIHQRGNDYGCSIAFVVEDQLKKESLRALKNIKDRIYFSPSSNTFNKISKNISEMDDSKKDWDSKLSHLKENQCVICTHTLIDENILSPKPIVVDVSNYKKNS